MKHAVLTGIGTNEEGIRVFIGESANTLRIAEAVHWYLANLRALDLRIVMETEDDLQTTTGN